MPTDDFTTHITALKGGQHTILQPIVLGRIPDDNQDPLVLALAEHKPGWIRYSGEVIPTAEDVVAFFDQKHLSKRSADFV